MEVTSQIENVNVVPVTVSKPKRKSEPRYVRHCFKLVAKSEDLSYLDLTNLVVDVVKNGPKGVENVKIINNQIAIITYLRPIRPSRLVFESSKYYIERFRYQKLANMITDVELNK